METLRTAPPQLFLPLPDLMLEQTPPQHGQQKVKPTRGGALVFQARLARRPAGLPGEPGGIRRSEPGPPVVIRYDIGVVLTELRLATGAIRRLSLAKKSKKGPKKRVKKKLLH